LHICKIAILAALAAIGCQSGGHWELPPKPPTHLDGSPVLIPDHTNQPIPYIRREDTAP
jgi:hypothetical protein